MRRMFAPATPAGEPNRGEEAGLFAVMREDDTHRAYIDELVAEHRELRILLKGCGRERIVAAIKD